MNKPYQLPREFDISKLNWLPIDSREYDTVKPELLLVRFANGDICGYNDKWPHEYVTEIAVLPNL